MVTTTIIIILLHIPGRTDAGIQVDQLASTIEILNNSTSVGHPLHLHHNQKHLSHTTDAGIQVDQLVVTIKILKNTACHQHHHNHNHHHHHHGRTDAGIQVDQLESTVSKYPQQHHRLHLHHHNHNNYGHHHNHHHHNHLVNPEVEFVDIFPTIVDAAEFEPLQLCPEISNTTLLCTEVVLKTNTHMEGGNTEKENNQKDDNLIQSVMFNTTHLFTEVVFNTNMEPHDLYKRNIRNSLRVWVRSIKN